jgi:DNA-directed RNA polymerase subunit RPC12/RpoP
MPKSRVKVSIRCHQCGERFVLRGRKDKGKVSTDFKQCLCNNESDFDVQVDDLDV